MDRIIQDHESEVFKLYFADWEDLQTLDEKGIFRAFFLKYRIAIE